MIDKNNEYATEQESFWAGDFGRDYIDRNDGDGWIASNLALFSNIIKNTDGVKSVLEIGANIGLNLNAIKLLLPKVKLHAVEINKLAAEKLKQSFDDIIVHQMSVFDYYPKQKCDLVFTKGVLIHINPDRLSEVYKKLYDASSKYILIAEYYNPSPITINYRGHKNKLFKRDFAGEIVDMYSELDLLDYGFVYHRDPNFPQDDLTWFLLKKQGS